MFRKRNLLLDSSRGTSTQTIVNNITDQCKAEMRDNDSETNSYRNSVHSNWSELIPINNEMNKTADVTKTNAQPRKRAIKNTVLVPYKPKPKDWGSWKIKSPYMTITIASPPLDVTDQNQNNEEVGYVPHSLYYAPVHPPEFYEDK